MKWINPKDEPPPQGKKILYFKKGDIYVVQRFADLWIPVPFFDSKYAFYDEPELWADIQPPEGFTGKLFVLTQDSDLPMDIDTVEKIEPDLYYDLVESQRKIWVKDE